MNEAPAAETTDAEAPAAEPIDAEAPATETPDAVAAIAAAREASKGWAATPLHRRADALVALKERILSRAEEIATLVHDEVGKPVEEAALAEVLPNADLVTYWLDHIEGLLEDKPASFDALAYPNKHGRVIRDPRGVVALITPWNYPVAIPLRTLLPAVLAGNAVVFKPSEVTPKCGALVASLFEGLVPEGVVTLLSGGAEVGEALVAGEVDAVVFTGSVTTGKAIARQCAERLIPCSLELGGKDAAIVLADCNLERTARGLVWGAFTNAGQNCAGIERVFVERAIIDKLKERVVAITKTLDPKVDTTALTTDAQRAKVAAHLDDAKKAGAEVLVGGEDPDDPTVLLVSSAAEDAVFLREETFGPVLPLIAVDDVDEAIRRTNASRYALTTSIWTKRVRAASELARKLRSGVVTINNHAFTAALPAAPWTGSGDTGFGVTNSPHCLGALTRPRFVLEDRHRRPELWWYPYTPALRTIAFAMARLRGGAGFFGRVGALFQLIATLPKRLLGKG